MIFNSITFFLFLPTVFFIYWYLLGQNRKLQNVFLLIASYVFYGWWDWRFLSLIILSTIVDYLVAKRIELGSSLKTKKQWLSLSLIFNLGLLGVFKYFNFFLSEFQELLLFFGVNGHIETLSIILPVGISFYTFQTLSYSLDVYRGKMEPTKDLLAFATYVGFFPQLVAGPIERASHLLPQFSLDRVFDLKTAISGMRLIVWGLFKKVVIADSLAPVVNQIFDNYSNESGSTLIIGAVLFAFQIYGDFSGYSDIAIGTAKLFGFDLMSNFKFPYFSRNIGEFWRRWHISLSTWFRDYLYIPLGGSKGSKLSQIRNIFIIFLVSGFWHGANWTFIAWGGLHAALFLPLFLIGSNRKHAFHEFRTTYNLSEWLGVITTFALVCLGWIFFRAESITIAFDYISSLRISTNVSYSGYLIFPLVLVLMEWFIRDDERLENIKLGRFELLVIGLFMAAIFIFRDTVTDFIYFQF